MNIYQIEFSQVGSDAIWSRHLGVASTPERALDLAREEALDGWDQKKAPIEIELKSLERIGTCGFIEKKLRRVA